MHLLLHLTPADYDAWRREFDADAETRMQAGLTMLQLWRAASGAEVSALFEVNDRKRAEGWLDRERATGPALEARFLRTA